MKDRTTEALLGALKTALAEPGEQRLFRSGKLAGLFTSKSGAPGAAALQAVRDGLLETARTEIKGKLAIDWVRLTPKGVEFLHQHESPIAVLRELQSALRASRSAVPAWLAGMQQQFDAFTQQMHQEMQQTLKRLESLADRVEEALRRSGSIGPELPAGVTETVPWAGEVMTYLEQRQGAGAPGDCPLPELFTAIRQRHAELSIVDFQDGLRRMYDHKAIRLLPVKTDNGASPEPEYVMCDGPDLLYYVSR
jgi:DNA-binding PadR family transcriptional regulator